MPIFTVTNGSRVLTVQAACRSCARNTAVEYIALTGPTADWRDPVTTKVALLSREHSSGNAVLTDSERGPIVRAD